MKWSVSAYKYVGRPSKGRFPGAESAIDTQGVCCQQLAKDGISRRGEAKQREKRSFGGEVREDKASERRERRRPSSLIAGSGPPPKRKAALPISEATARRDVARTGQDGRGRTSPAAPSSDYQVSPATPFLARRSVQPADSRLSCWLRPAIPCCGNCDLGRVTMDFQEDFGIFN